MHPALWISKTGLDAQQTGISVISNNLANVNTVGFKKGRGVFEDLLYQNIQQPGSQSSQNTQLPSGLMLGTGVKVVATEKVFTAGNIIQTNSSLDMAISGDGFFQVQTPDGNTGYTRNGEFQVSATGELVNASGYVMQPAITVPTGASQITIGRDGTVSAILTGETASTEIGTIQLANFINPAGLQAMGQNLFKETPASGAPTIAAAGSSGLGALMQGSLESSNVNAVEELVNMIETQRAYEMNSKAVSTVDRMLEFVAQNL